MTVLLLGAFTLGIVVGWLLYGGGPSTPAEPE